MRSAMDAVRTLIADSTDITLSGIRAILKSAPPIEVAATAFTSSEAVKKTLLHHPDICLISDNLEGLILPEFMKQLTREEGDRPKVILLTEGVTLPRLNLALRTGITGYLTKSVDRKELVNAILEVSRGEKVFSKPIARLMTERYVERARRRGDRPGERLTSREAEILHLIVEGYTSTEIGKLLFISPRTVETHRYNLLHKLKIKNTAGLVKYALERNL